MPKSLTIWVLRKVTKSGEFTKKPMFYIGSDKFSNSLVDAVICGAYTLRTWKEAQYWCRELSINCAPYAVEICYV